MLKILFEDFHLIAINKSAGLLTQAPPEIPSLEAQVKLYIKEKYNKPAGVYLGIPHRLDRSVSGVILFARNTKAASRVAEQFQKHTTQKIYWALVEGEVTPELGTWRHWQRKVPEESRAEVVIETTLGAKEAITHYRVLQMVDGVTLLKLTLETGRTHQLRLATACCGHPILGDRLYGSKQAFGANTERPQEQVIALHAQSLKLSHPFQKTELKIEATLPDYWPDWCRRGFEKESES